MQFVATCNPGLEEIACKEIREKIGKKAKVLHLGAISFKGKENDIFVLNYLAKSLHRILVLLAQSEVESLDQIYKLVRQIDFSQWILPEQTFAVRTKRSGKHSFTSMDISATIGQAIIDSFLEQKGIRLKVNLSKPDLVFRAELRGKNFFIGLDTSGESLHKRWYRKYTYITSLRSTIAYSMVRLSELKRGESFIDPMCGLAMIPIEAYHWLAKKPNKYRNFAFEKFFWLDQVKFERFKEKYKEKIVKKAKIFASDINKKVVKFAKENSKLAEAPIKFFVADATKQSLDFDKICVDLPYGIRMRRENIPLLYKKFFDNVLKSDFKKLVFITARQAAKWLPKGLEFEKVYDVEYGELKAKIFVLDG
jgi:tRNA (guanine6-N2)-methyltransferase